MSVREGTRRKKISVLHMLGTWEGKIEGCNCPSCKEYDEEQAGSHGNRVPTKVTPKTLKGQKASPKKTVIKVKTTKVVVDVGTGALIGRKVSPKKHTLKRDDNANEQKVSNLLADFERNEECSDGNTDSKSERGECVTKKVDNSVIATGVGLSGKELASYCKDSNLKRVIGRKKTVFEGSKHGKEKSEDWISQNDSSVPELSPVQKVVVLSSELKAQNTLKQDIVESVGDKIQIKQEPLDFFSDEEDFDGDENGKLLSDGAKNDSRVRKRARMVTSEVENIYAKPRMIFTGKGVVKKFEPGLDKTPKSKRGRKPTKCLSPVKVKQEPKDDDNEEHELDQLQKALTEAAESLDVGDDLLDVLDEFEEGPKEVKVRNKTKFKLFKRVDSDGDKYVECNMCFKMLKESSMKQHYRTHTGEKPHKCDECDARFTRKGDVERHKRLVHKNQKPFKCRKCKRNFSDRKNLKLHLQNHDKAIYYACNTCGFKFGKREYYENHIRYIHPLPEGSLPVFGDIDQDIAIEQLQEIEKEEKKEKQEKEGKCRSETLSPVKNELESLDHDDEEATEITVTEGLDGIPKTRKYDDDCIHKDLEDDGELSNMEVDEGNDSLDASCVIDKVEDSVDIRVSRGTLSFTQMVSDTDTQDEDLVNKVIADAVNQATNTIESLQTIAGANMSGNYIDIDEDDEEEVMEDNEFQEILDSQGYDIIPIGEQKPLEQPSEIHINASVGGQKKKYIIQVPPGSNINVQSPEGMEMIVSMVYQLCGGKGELDGPIEVVMQSPGARTLALD